MSRVSVVALVLVVGLASTGLAKEKAEKAGKCGKARKTRMEAMDADGNGTVSLAEYAAAHEKRMEARKAKMGDKWNEKKAAKMPSAETLFKRLDKDGDGALTADELQRKRGRKNKGEKAPKKVRKMKAEKAKAAEAEVEEDVEM